MKIKSCAILMLTVLFAARLAPICGAAGGQSIEQLLDIGEIARVNEVIKGLPSGVDQRSWRAKALFYSGDYAAAQREMAALEGEAAPDKSWLDLQNYFGALADIWKEVSETESAHFRFRTNGIDAILAPYALESLEKAYGEIGRDLSCFPGGKVLVEVYRDKESFSLASTLSVDTIEKSGTIGICKFNRLMILSPQSLPLGYRWLDTLSHEYVHFLVNRKSGGRCPLWLHEGVARYHETRWRLESPEYLTSAGRNQLGEALKQNSLISFKRMHPSLVYLKDQAEISLAFCEVASAVEFIRTGFGAERLAAVLDCLAGSDEKVAFKQAIGLSPGSFEKKWREYLKTLELSPSPGALAERVRFENIDEEQCIGADQRGLVRLGDRLRAIGRPDAAVIQYEKALAAEPANPVILLKAGRALIAAGDQQKAEERLQTAVEKNPGYVTPYQALGELYFKKQDYAKSIAILREAVAINPFHPATHYYLSRAFLKTNEYQEAGRELQVLTMLDSSDGESRVLLDRIRK